MRLLLQWRFSHKNKKPIYLNFMFRYPLLTPAEQADLPKLLAEPSAMPNKFEDSTHALWHCQTTDGEMVLKVCNHASVAKSHFWLGLNHLFAVDFPNSLSNIHLTHDFLMLHGALKVPELVAASANRFVLTRFLPGVDLEATQMDDKWLVALAKHIAKLHQRTYQEWGSLHAPQFVAADWSKRLHQTLKFLAEKSDTPIAEEMLSEILALAENVEETQFVPMMLDLRWDQLRCLSNNNLALVDLDAFVVAPRALDLILVEYLLNPEQLNLFKQHYVQTQDWPDNAAQKPCYQLLLFLMHVLGETDLQRWMQRF
jgi:hypothetical protein